MHAITNPEPGRLEWAQVPDPVPGPEEVLVKVAASAVNRADLLQVAGLYKPPPGASPYPGLECSGTTPLGEPVCALLAGGGYAELVTVPIRHLMPIPKGVTLQEAGALPEAACTVWSNLTMIAGLRAGQTVLIHGGGSGIGTFAIQYAKALGATVITTARAAKHDFLRELGADQCIDYTTEDFTGAAADVVLDIMGASYLDRNIKALATNGKLVIIGLQGGRAGELDIAAMMAKRAVVTGALLRPQSIEEKANIIKGVLDEVWPMIEDGRIRPVIDRTFPMADAAQAHRLVAEHAHVGKVLLSA